MFEKIQPEKRGPGAHTMKLMKSRSNTAKEKKIEMTTEYDKKEKIKKTISTTEDLSIKV